MCGIAGFIGGGDADTAASMATAIKHRGPDASGSVYKNGVGFAHRRLSVVDLSPAGTQPMTSADGRYTIVYNGEVYNFRELRKQFLSGASLHSNTDTELVIELFALKGIDAFDLLRGMYSIAIFDWQKSILYLHRDRLGKKPLYWSYTSDKCFIFGSELKALRQHTSCPTEVDELAIYQYLHYEYIPTPRTIYKDISKLIPGGVLIFDGSSITETTVPESTHQSFNYSSPIDTLEGLLEDAVRTRLIADVPIGMFLSGGLDSSTIVAMAQRQVSEPIQTFSIGFSDSTFDEQKKAQRVANYIGTNHQSTVLNLVDIQRIIPKLPQVLDEPIGDSSILPTILVSEYARNHVKVCLTGDGADELFLGYDTFFAHRLAARYELLPKKMRRKIAHLAKLLPVSHHYMSFDFKLKRFLLGAAGNPFYRNSTWLSALTLEQIDAITTTELDFATILEPVLDLYKASDSVWAGIKTEYLHGFLLDDILVKADRASMSVGLELRSPFLDENVVSFALALDDKMKVRGSTSKFIVKKVAERYLPHDIVWSKKQGFNLPIGSLIKNELQDEFKMVLLDGGLRKFGIFDRVAVEQLLTEHIDGTADNRKGLWSLYVLALWAEEWI